MRQEKRGEGVWKEINNSEEGIGLQKLLITWKTEKYALFQWGKNDRRGRG